MANSSREEKVALANIAQIIEMDARELQFFLLRPASDNYLNIIERLERNLYARIMEYRERRNPSSYRANTKIGWSVPRQQVTGTRVTDSFDADFQQEDLGLAEKEIN